MEKLLFKFLVYELIERITRLGLLLDELGNSGSGPGSENATGFSSGKGIPTLLSVMHQRLQTLQHAVLNERELFNLLLADNGKGEKNHSQGLFERLTPLADRYDELNALSMVLLKLAPDNFCPEGHLFLRDILPDELQLKSGHLTVFLDEECSDGFVSESIERMGFARQEVLLATVSVLQKQNLLGWLNSLRPFGLTMAASQPGFTPVRALFRSALREFRVLDHPVSEQEEERLFNELVSHAIALRLAGPAYYFHSVTDCLLKNLRLDQQSGRFLNLTEPTLFYGLNHFSFSANILVILHEGVERIRKDMPAPLPTLNDPTFLSELYRVIEKVIPDQYAFSNRQFERAVALKEKLSDQGTLISSASVFSIEDVAGTLAHQRESGTFAIYELLTMMTEQPHTAREIINAGWLYKAERIPVWLCSALQQDEPFAHLATLISAQDHLLGKSIETAEVHRVLLCNPKGQPTPV